MEAMWLMLQQEVPDDYVIATGQTTSLRKSCKLCFSRVELPLEWKGQLLVQVAPRYYRTTEDELLLGDASKARRELGWKRMVRIDQLAYRKVDHDLEVTESQQQAVRLKPSIGDCASNESRAPN